MFAIYRLNYCDYDKAIKHLKLALKSDLKTYGEDHPTIATCHNNLGGAWQALGKHEKAIKHLKLALKSHLKTYGEDHSTVAICHNNLSGIWQTLGEYDTAIKHLKNHFLMLISNA
jgi:tetratricopeptide (TPR) repeat protein